MKILLIGSKGQLGQELMHLAQFRKDQIIGTDLPECDITNEISLQQAFEQADKPDIVINTAAYTAVDKAEAEPDMAFAINRDGPGLIARLCRYYQVPLIHISTDYVFDGSSRQPYQPTDSLCPKSVYGRSKAEGETAVRRTWGKHVILRTSWLFGLHGPNFVKTMLRLGKERKTLNVVDDQAGSPTYARDLAAAIMRISDHLNQKESGWGTYHFCNQGIVKQFGF